MTTPGGENRTERRTLPDGAVYTHTDPKGDPKMREQFDAALARQSEYARLARRYLKPKRYPELGVSPTLMSEYIEGLQTLLAEHGDAPLVTIEDRPCLLPCFVDEQSDDLVPAFVMDGNS